MSKLDAMFILQSRAGHVSHINFEKLKSLCDLDLVLVGSQTVLEDVTQQGYMPCLTGAVAVDDAFDFHDLAPAIAEHAKDAGYDGFIVATVNESKNLLVDCLNAHFGQTQPREIEKFVRKDRMKDFLVSEGLIEGPYTCVDKAAFKSGGRAYLTELAAQYGYPIFIKPVDMYASKHCARLENDAAFESFMQSIALNEPSAFHIEPFMDGMLYGCDSIVVGGEVVFSQVIQFSHPNVHVHTRSCLGWITVPDDDPVGQDIHAFSKQINERMLQSRDGVTHLEAFHHHGTPTFLEISFRPIGGEPTPFYQRRANIPLREVHLALQAGSSFRVPHTTPNHVAYFHLNFGDWPGIVTGRSLPDIESSHEIEWFCKPGESVPRNSGFDAFAGSLILWNSDYAALRRDFARISEHPAFVSLEKSHARAV